MTDQAGGGPPEETPGQGPEDKTEGSNGTHAPFPAPPPVYSPPPSQEREAYPPPSDPSPEETLPRYPSPEQAQPPAYGAQADPTQTEYPTSGYPPTGYPPPGAGYGYGYPPRPVDPFGRPLASWGQRVGAFLLDFLIVGVPGLIIVAVINSSTSQVICNGVTCHRSGDPYLLGLIVAVVEILYFAILDGNSQSVGKRAVGIAVRSEATGQPLGFWRALGRWAIWTLLGYLFFIPGLLNALSPLWDRKRQAWHDHAVGSLVVQVR